jgi:hypothetical protein
MIQLSLPPRSGIEKITFGRPEEEKKILLINSALVPATKARAKESSQR